MRSKLKLSKKYIKTYKESSFSIVMSIILSISLIVGVITLKETNNNLELQNMRYESGIYDANFEKINKNQVEKLMSYKNIENLGLKSVYKQTSSSERQNIEIVGANDEYILNNSMIKKGRLPKNSKEIIAEEWVLRNFGITPKIDKEITLKVKDKNDKTKEEKFKLVGILSDKAMEKSAAKMQLFVPIDLENHKNIEASLSFKNDVDIYSEIKKMCKDCKIKNENVYLNNDMISLKMSNNKIDINDIKILIIMAFVCFIVINGIFNISVCKRINEYGILRAIGFNKFDIFKLIINEVMTLYFISIPIGIILGILGANIFNNFARNVNTEFIFNGRIVEIGMVYPSFLIILSIILIGVINILISILSYIQINKLSIVDSINKNFNIKNKKREILKTNYLKKFIKGYNIISFKNIFRNKMRFLEIILSMSICGVMFISLNYKLELDMNMTSEGFKSQFMNGDFMIDEFVADTTMTGISSKSYKELSKISGVENIESSMVMPSRMVIDKNDISNKEYFKNINDSSKDMYFKSLLDKDKKTKEIILKNNIKGYNDNALKKMNDYLLSGDVNLKDLKEKDLAILYIPQIVGDNPFPQFNKNGKNVLDIKVGDKIKVKFRKDRDVSSDDYWTMNDKGDYEYKTFEVGAISYYPYMNETSVIGYSTVEVIISEENFRKIMGIDAYTSLNVN